MSHSEIIEIPRLFGGKMIAQALGEIGETVKIRDDYFAPDGAAKARTSITPGAGRQGR